MMISLKNVCLNCGKVGHQLRLCDQAIISYGIICFNISKELNIDNKLIENFFYNKFLDIEEYNYTNLDNIKYIPYFYDKIKILMIRRKFSLNYLEFVRGKYDLKDINQINKIFKLMSAEENIKIRNSNFDELWNELWKYTAKNKIYQKEYNLSKIKFEELKKNNFFNLLDNDNLSSYDVPEWGFPKGRRNINETNLDCAVREFIEETTVDLNELHILERLNCISEEYAGTNGVNYKHIYYMASSDNTAKINITDNYHEEIGDIEWCTIPDAINKLRPYYDKKIKIIHLIYFFLINLVIDIKLKDNKQITI